MKSLVISICVSLVTFCVFGQKINVALGPPIDANQMKSMLGITTPKFSFFSRPSSFSYSSTTFYDTLAKKAYVGVGFASKSYQVSVLDDYLRSNGFKALKAEFVSGQAEEVHLEGFFQISNRFYVFYTIAYKSSDEFSLYVNEMSKDIVLMGSPILIQNFKELKKYGSSLSINSSEKKEYLLITRDLNTKSREPQKFECKAIDTSFGEVWYKSFELEFQDKEITLQASEVDTHGNLYFLAEIGKKKNKEPILYTYFWKTKSFKHFKPGLKEGDNYGYSIELGKSEYPYLIGLNLNKKVISYVFNRINTQAETLEPIGTGELPPNFKRIAGMGYYAPEDWNVTGLLTLSNGDLVATVEAPLMTTYKNGMPINNFSYYTVVISFKQDGTMKWSHIVRKKQMAYNPMVLGSLVIPFEDKVIVIYNDNPLNIKKDVNKIEIENYNMKTTLVTVQEIDTNGKVSKYALSTSSELQNYSINIMGARIIQKGLYSTSFSNYKKILNPITKNAVLQVK